MAEQLGHSWAEDRMAGEVERLLQASPSYAALDNATQRALADSLAVVARAAGSGRSTPAASSLAGISDLRQQMAQPGTAGGASPGQGATGQLQPGGAPPPGAAPGSGGQAGPTSRVGDVARATLNAIDFPAFVAGLIQGTFQAIVDASIQQMEAYAELLKNVAMSLDKFMDDNVSEQSAKDHLADQYEDVFARDTSDGEAKLIVKKNGSAPSALPSFLSDLGFESANDIDDEAV